MTKLTCSYCERKFSSKSNLATHQRTAKYCLKIQGEEVNATCKYCQASYSRESSLVRHLENCSEYKFSIERAKYEEKCEAALGKIAEEITVLKSKLSKLEADSKKIIAREKTKDRLLREKTKEIAKLLMEKKIAHKDGQIETFREVGDKPQNVTNYIHPKLVNIPINNIRPLTIATVREDMHKYTYGEFLRGLSGLKEFVEDIIVTEVDDDEAEGYERNYVCTDVARNKFHRLLESKEWTADGGARFINTILDELQGVATEHFQTLVDEEREAVSDEFKREQIDATKAIVKPVYFGIADTGENRKRLFKALRNEIKSTASV